MKLLVNVLCILMTFSVFAQGEQQINTTDTDGKRQGKWIIYGKDVPESGIPATGIVEEGMYVNDQKAGVWTRYDKDGVHPNALIYFRYDEKTKTSVRENIFPFKYYSDGQIQHHPYAGKCSQKADYKRFDSNGNLLEIMEYDADCNESFLVAHMDSTSIEGLTYFQIPDSYQKKIETGSITAQMHTWGKDSGTFLVDFNHITFQTGQFKDGILWNGKECVVDEGMNLISVRIFENGKYKCSYLPAA